MLKRESLHSLHKHIQQKGVWQPNMELELEKIERGGGGGGARSMGGNELLVVVGRGRWTFMEGWDDISVAHPKIVRHRLRRFVAHPKTVRHSLRRFVAHHSRMRH